MPETRWRDSGKGQAIMDDEYRWREVECMGCSHRFKTLLHGFEYRLNGRSDTYYQASCPKCGAILYICWENGTGIPADALDESEAELTGIRFR